MANMVMESKKKNPGDKKKILLIGNHSKVKGGITSVISQIRSCDWEKYDIKMDFIPTYLDSNNFLKIIYFIISYFRIRLYIFIQKPDLVYIHMSYRGSFMRKYQIHKFCRKCGIPDVIHLHGSEFMEWYGNSNEKKKEKIRTLLKECASVIVLGKIWEKRIRSIEPQTKLVVLPNTIAVQENRVSLQRHNKLLFLGMLIPRKGVMDLLEVIRMLEHEKKMDNWELVIAGTGPQEKELKEYVERYHLSKVVEFTGWVNGVEKEALLQSSQCLILPSYNEGLPIAILEAMSYGMPIIATDVGDVSSAVIDQKNGFLIEPGNLSMMKDAISKLIIHEDLWYRFSETSRLLIQNQFNEENYFECLREVFDRAM